MNYVNEYPRFDSNMNPICCYIFKHRIFWVYKALMVIIGFILSDKAMAYYSRTVLPCIIFRIILCSTITR